MAAAPSTVRCVARIPSGIAAPAAARRWAQWLADALDPAAAEGLMIVVSELVTNAVRHAGLPPGAPIEVSGQVGRDRVTLTVRDRGAGLPAVPSPEPPPPESIGSRGLYLVARLSARVLMEPAAGAVTCEFVR